MPFPKILQRERGLCKALTISTDLNFRSTIGISKLKFEATRTFHELHNRIQLAKFQNKKGKLIPLLYRLSAIRKARLSGWFVLRKLTEVHSFQWDFKESMLCFMKTTYMDHGCSGEACFRTSYHANSYKPMKIKRKVWKQKSVRTAFSSFTSNRDEISSLYPKRLESR